TLRALEDYTRWLRQEIEKRTAPSRKATPVTECSHCGHPVMQAYRPLYRASKIRRGTLQHASRAVLGFGSILALMAVSSFAWAETVVDVTLQDATSEGNVTGMKMTATPASIKAGRVTIRATNRSQGLVHEV